MTDTSASHEIDAIIEKAADWRGEKLSHLRILVRKSVPDIIEEVKWKKPSRPEGVPVWSRNGNGNICIAELLKNAVRLTFPRGASIDDPEKLFNTRLDSKMVRAIDFYEAEAINEAALKTLIITAAAVTK